MNKTSLGYGADLAEWASLGKLLNDHRQALLAMVARRLDRRLAPRLHAEDVVSDAFLLAQKKWDDYQNGPGVTPYVWLYRLCLDCLIAAWRREHRARCNVRLDMPLPEES